MKNQLAKVFLISVLIVIVLWGVGYFLAPNKIAFVSSRSWIYNLFWFPVHIVLAYFSLQVYKRALNSVKEHTQEGYVLRDEVKRVLRTLGLAFLLTLPFIVMDGFEGAAEVKEKFDELGNSGWIMVGGIWFIEWLAAGVIWARVIATIRLTLKVYTSEYVQNHLEEILIFRPSSPLLQAGVENALIIFVYGVTTFGYIFYCGGESSDYLTLAISGFLVLVSFLASFLHLRQKLSEALERVVATHSARIEQYCIDIDTIGLSQEALGLKLDPRILDGFVFNKPQGISKRPLERLTIVRMSLFLDSIKRNQYADGVSVDAGIQAMRYTKYELKLASVGIVELQTVLLRLGSPVLMILAKSGLFTPH